MITVFWFVATWRRRKEDSTTFTYHMGHTSNCYRATLLIICSLYSLNVQYSLSSSCIVFAVFGMYRLLREISDSLAAKCFFYVHPLSLGVCAEKAVWVGTCVYIYVPAAAQTCVMKWWEWNWIIKFRTGQQNSELNLKSSANLRGAAYLDDDSPQARIYESTLSVDKLDKYL